MRSMVKDVLTESHLKAIGHVAAEWSWTEMCLEYLIWEVAQINSARGSAFTTHLTSETRINILSTLAHIGLASATLNKELAVIISRVRSLRSERNNIIHSLWLSSKPYEIRGLIESAMRNRRKPVPAAMKVTAKGKIVVTTKPLTAKQIMAVASQIGELLAHMYDFLDRLRQHKASGGIGLEKS